MYFNFRAWIINILFVAVFDLGINILEWYIYIYIYVCVCVCVYTYTQILFFSQYEKTVFKID
jgi:hypothetical protein